MVTGRNQETAARLPTPGDGYDPDAQSVPWTKDEIRAALVLATPSPVMIGQRVLYRHDHHGDIVDAVVTDIDDDHPSETTLVNGLAIPLPPWPTLLLETVVEGRECEVKTREARVRGSAGWLPPGFWITR